MSSTDKKKFEIAETSKQAGVDITSDKILLPADSDDHVLVATVPSSANCTAGVNVEVEMSPDGEHWCPVQAKTVVSSAGGSTANTTIVSNLKYVNLEPSGTDLKDRHARGSLSFDINNNPVTYETGVRDMMHQHMDVGKSFNYSQWWKTSHLPTSTYKPVLFRHGGYDNFENTQVVDLTDPVTQNLCNADTSNSTYLQFNPQTTGNFTFSSFISSSTSVTSPFYNSSTNPTNAFPQVSTTETLRQDGDDDVSGGFSIGFWLKVDSPINTSNGYTSIINTYAGPSNNLLQIGICSYSGFKFFWRMSSSTGSTLAYAIFGGTATSVIPGSGWNYIVLRMDTSRNLVHYVSSFSINGAAFPSNNAANNAANNNSGMSVLNNWSTNADDISIVKFNMNYSGATQSIGADFAIDSLVFIDGLISDSVVGSLYANANNPYNASLNYTLQGLSSTGSGLTVNKYYTPSVRSFMKCGDGPNDNISTAGAEVIEADNGLQMTAGGITTNHTFSNYVTGELPGAAVANSFPAIFNSTSDFSVSGWFKTTDTGTLFSNGPLASLAGIQLDITGGTGYDLKLGTNTHSLTSFINLNDDKWHLITLVYDSFVGSYNVSIDNYQAQVVFDNNTDPKGSYGFTLLGDGQNNVAATNPSSTDASKLNASLSNWSIHSEALDEYGIKQLYSNGHVRNAMNLPAVDSTKVEAYWQLNDGTSPEQDLSGNGYDLTLQTPNIWGNEQYIEGVSAPFTSIGEGVYKEVNNGGFFSSGQSGSESAGSRNYFYGYNNTLNFWLHVPSNYTADTESIPLLVDYNDTTGTTDYFLYVQYYPSINTLRYGGKNAGVQTGINVKLDNTDGEGDVTGQWCMVTILLGTDPGAATCYINGNLRTSTSFGTGTSRPSSSVAINASLILGNGNRAQNSTAFPAYTGISGASVKIDNIDCFVDTLTSTEISSLYNSGTPKNASTVNSTVYQSLKFETNDGDSETTINCQVSNVQYDKNTSITATYLTSYLNTDPMYTQGGAASLTDFLIPATGATLAEKTINGNALTLSLTKNFNFTTNEWVSDASGDTAVCMSLNGFEEQAEYFVLWKCAQTFGTDTIDLCDGNWHNLILCYRGASDAGPENEGNIVKFGPQNSSDYNFTLCMDGISLDSINGSVGADFIGGLGSGIVLDNTSTKNAGFPLYNRHLRYELSNTEEEYKPHCQFAPGIYDWSGEGLDDPNNFQGQVDETSFHSDNWWLDSSGQIFENDFNNEKAYTIYGRTNALDNRGDGTDYPRGVPYGLLNPEYLVLTSDINDIAGTNQFINPIRKGDTQPWDSQVSTGGLEGWWRWGDIGTDCSRDINDVKDDTDSVDYRDLKVKALSDTNTHDIAFLSTSDSIYLAESTTSSPTAGFEYVNVILENLTALLNTATCTTKHLSSQIYQYLRIKLTGSGSCDIGDDKLKIEVHHKKRRMK